jgi:hypothetical protein
MGRPVAGRLAGVSLSTAQVPAQALAPLPRLPGRLAFAIVFTLSAIMAAGSLPLLSLEQDRDWHTFQAAAERLLAGLSPSFDGGTVGSLYPPAMALLWAAGVTGMAWLLLGLVCAGAVSVMGRGIERPAIALLALLQVPVLYDLLLGNVMTMYAGAIAWVLVVPGCWGAIPFGLLLAIAAKPAILPFVVVLLIVRRGVGLRTLGVAVAVSAAVLLILGPGPYVDYARALLAGPGFLSTWVTGNLGLARLGLLPAALGIVVGIGLSVLGVRRLVPELALAVALGAALLVQSTLGWSYGTLLIPAVILLWRVDRLGALAAAVATIVATNALSPVVGGLFVIGFAFAVPFEQTVVDPARRVLARYHRGPAARRPLAPP